MITGMLEYFTSLVAEDDGLPLTETALALAQDAYPEVDLQDTLAKIDALVVRLRQRLPANAVVVQKLHRLNDFFFGEIGFSSHANDDEAINNHYLHTVLHQRCGIAVSVAILYMEIAMQIGLSVGGVLFPGRFVIRVRTPIGEAVIDPIIADVLTKEQLVHMLGPHTKAKLIKNPSFNVLNTLLKRAKSRQIIAHMLRSLKKIYMQTQRWQRLLAVQQRLVILLPNHIEERRDRGFTFARLEYFQPALEDLQFYLDKRPDAEDAAMIQSQLACLRQQAQDSGF